MTPDTKPFVRQVLSSPWTIPLSRPKAAAHLVVVPFVGLAVAYYLSEGQWIGAVVAVGAPLYLLVALRWPFFLIPLLMVGDPTVFVFPDGFLPVGAPVNASRAIVATVVFVGVFRLLMRREERVGLITVEKIMLLYLFVAAASWLAHVSGKPMAEIKLDAAIYIKGLAMPAILFIVARRIQWTQARANIMFAGFVAVLLYLGLTGLLQFQFDLDVFRRAGYLLIQTGRATGSFGSSVEYGAVLTILLLVAIFLMGRVSHRGVLLLLLLASAGALTGISLSFTRAVWLGLGAAAFFVIVRTRRTRAVGPLLLGTVAVAAFLILQPQLSGSEVDERLNDSGTIYNRLALYSTATNMFAHNAVFGVGFGALSYNRNKPDYYAPFGDVSAQWAAQDTVPHNQFLFVAVQTGIVGLVFFVLIFANMWRLLSRVRRGASDQDWGQASFATFVQGAMIATFVHSLFADVVFFSYLMLLLFFLAGMATSGAGANPTTRRRTL